MKRYQVFISSTYSNLKEERQAVLESILKLRHIPVGMEQFVAANEEQFNYIRRLIDETDYYVLIIGNRYGTTADDGISYTEKEFDYAVSKGIPILAFVHINPDSLPANKSEKKATGRNQLKRFREKVTNNRLVSMVSWDTPASLSREVVVALTNVMNDHPQPGWERVGNQESNKKNIVDSAGINQKLVQIVNYALGENIKLNRRSYSLHKTNPEAQESRLGCDDSIEIMTNSLSYDLDEESIIMIANSLVNSVKYYYYLEKNPSTTNYLIKFLNGIALALDKVVTAEDKKKLLQENLHIQWLPENVYPYSFVLINRPKTLQTDHGSLYFVKSEENDQFIYEVLLDKAQNFAGDLKAVFEQFRNNMPEIKIMDYIIA